MRFTLTRHCCVSACGYCRLKWAVSWHCERCRVNLTDCYRSFQTPWYHVAVNFLLYVVPILLPVVLRLEDLISSLTTACWLTVAHGVLFGEQMLQSVTVLRCCIVERQHSRAHDLLSFLASVFCADWSARVERCIGACVDADMGSDSPYWFLTDGVGTVQSSICHTAQGHSDNLGLLALLRKRCDLIVVFDASEDPKANRHWSLASL